MVKYSIVLIISCVIIVLIAGIFFSPDLFSSFLKKQNKGTIVAENSVDNEQTEFGKETQSANEDRIRGGSDASQSSGGGDSAGSLSSTGSSGGGVLGIGCEESQISYALKNFTIIQETCNVFNAEICESKTITCSLYVQNLDDDTSGTFYIDFYFFDASFNNENAFDIVSINKFISADSTEVFEASSTITSTGEEGIANQDLDCSFLTTSVPTKEVC